MRDFSKMINRLVILYLSLPIIIFLLGWVKPLIAIPTSIIILYCLYQVLKVDGNLTRKITITKKEFKTLISIFLIILLWVYLSGIGKLVFQNSDHLARNPIFELLVNCRWPVVKTVLFEGVDTPFILVYYIGFWLPSALVGKLFGITAGFFFQVIWAAMGIWLFYYLVCCQLNKISVVPLIIFIFFSGLDAFGTAILSGSYVPVTGQEHIEWWTRGMQFSSFTTQLFWVFNQALPAWLLTMLILLQKTNKYIVLLLGVSLICCPLPFMGVLPFALYVIIRNRNNSDNKNLKFDHLFSVENIIGGGIAGIITFLYFRSNQNASNIGDYLTVSGDMNNYLFSLFMFILLEVGVYFIVIYKYQKKNPLFYIVFIFLTLCPMIRIGGGADFCMRASIPALTVLYIMVIQTIYKMMEKKDKISFIAICIILVLGSITPIHEINRTVIQTITNYPGFNNMPAISEEELITQKNFGARIDDNYFYEYLARQ